MTNNVKKTLFLPFEKGLFDFSKDSKILFLGAEDHPFLKEPENIDFCQFWHAPVQGLHAAGYHAVQEFPLQGEYDFVLCLLPKQKEEAQAFLGKGAHLLVQGGTLMAAAANDAGGSRIEGWLKEMGFLVPQKISKHKARVVWGKKEGLTVRAQEWALQGDLKNIEIEGDRYFSQAGLFGWNRVDQGSKLLSKYVAETVSGTGADFGCGYGYLSRQILKQSSKIKKFYAFDADARAVRAAQKNLEEFAVKVQWVDLTKPLSDLPLLDFIVMNPPFHTGKKTCGDLGQMFIRSAYAALKPGGRLFMVANAHLPYEKILEELFSHIQKPVQQDGFKIFEAIR